jgi:uncharacterized protein (DUF2267 family)
MTHGDHIATTVATTHRWVNTIADSLPEEQSERAYQVLRAVLHGLRDRLGADVGAHLSSQLPTLVRGIWFEGYDPAKPFHRLSLDEFVTRVALEAGLKGTSEAEDAIRAVFTLLWKELSEGMMDHVVAVLPSEFATLM